MWAIENALMGTVAPTSTPSAPDSDPNDGYCANANVWFLGYAIAGAALWGITSWVDWVMRRPPTSGLVNYGRPWAICQLLISIATWTIIPPAVAFFIFHIILNGQHIPVFLAMSRITCTNVYGQVPFIGIWLFTQGISFVILYRAKPYVEALGQLVFPDGALRGIASRMLLSDAKHTASRPPVILVYGGTARGTVCLQAAKRASSQYNDDAEIRRQLRPPRVVLADVSNLRQFVAVNAEAMGLLPGDAQVVSVGPLHPTSAIVEGQANVRTPLGTSEMPEGKDPLLDDRYSTNVCTSGRSLRPQPEEAFRPLMLPLELAEVDHVILSPFVRKMPPIGDYVMAPEVSQRHFSYVAAELRRVMRPGAQVHIVDSLVDCLATEHDFTAAGFKLVKSTSYTGAKLGAIFYMKMKQYECVFENVPPDASAAAHAERLDQRMTDATGATASEALRAVPCSTIMYGGENSQQTTENNLLAPSSPAGPITVDASGSAVVPTVTAAQGQGYVALLVTQFVVFLVLLLVAGFLAGPLDVPKVIVVNSRVGNIPMNVACGYPIMAYFSRMASQASPPCVSVLRLLQGVLKREVLATVVACLFAALMGVPQLAIQWALVDTSLSSDTRSWIGIGLSALIALIGYWLGSRSRLTTTLRAYSIEKERYDTLEQAK
jgi:hypothetical protein